MSTTFHQTIAKRPGRPAHRSELRIACGHGAVSGETRILNAEALPPADAQRRTLVALHAQIHTLVKRHGDRWRCVCARPVFVLCWPNLERATTIGALAGGRGGSIA